jgi:hypothetical protein
MDRAAEEDRDSVCGVFAAPETEGDQIAHSANLEVALQANGFPRHLPR